MATLKVFNIGLNFFSVSILLVAQLRPVVPISLRITLGVCAVALIVMNVVIWRGKR